jgi:hypothetical protein
MSTNGNQNSAGTLSTACSRVSPWTTRSTTPAVEPKKIRSDGECQRCGDTLSFYVQTMSGRLVSWCVACREELVIERRRMPRE